MGTRKTTATSNPKRRRASRAAERVSVYPRRVSPAVARALVIAVAVPISLAACHLVLGLDDLNERPATVTDAGGKDAAWTEAIALVTGVNSYAIAVDDVAAYYTVPDPIGSVFNVPLAGGAPLLLGSAGPDSLAIATDGTNVYWNTAAAISSAPINGGPSKTIASVFGQNGIQDLAVDTINVYYAVEGLDAGAAGYVRRDGTGGAWTLLAGGPPFSIAADPNGSFTGVYFTERTSVWSFREYDAGVRLIDEGDGGAPFAITSDGVFVYWLLPNAKLYRRTNVPSAGVINVPLPHVPRDIAVVAGTVYSLSDDGTVYATSGLTSVLIASGQVAPRRIAANGTTVVWTTSTGVVKAVRSAK